MCGSTLFSPLPLLASPYPADQVFATSTSYKLSDLIRDIKEHLGTSSGIGYKDVDEKYLVTLAEKYVSNPNDWARFYHNCPGKSYTRNAIENINLKANILLLVWNPGKGSPIHDHANAHCVMKILAGELTETVYHHPEKTYGKPEPLKVKHQTTYHTDQVTYISDEIGLHRVHNPRSDQVAVSLHLYTPPNAADIGYNIFDGVTGKASFVPKATCQAAP